MGGFCGKLVAMMVAKGGGIPKIKDKKTQQI